MIDAALDAGASGGDTVSDRTSDGDPLGLPGAPNRGSHSWPSGTAAPLTIAPSPPTLDGAPIVQ